MMSEKPTGMTIPEKQAYDWALKQGFQSVSADYARRLAQYIERSHKQLDEAHAQVTKWMDTAGDLQTEIGRLEARDKALVMSDEERNAYEWGIEQGPQAVDGDYACRLAQYIKRTTDEAATLGDAVDELLEVAGLRGDNDLPHPADDPKTWTARMQEAWDVLASLREGSDGGIIKNCDTCAITGLLCPIRNDDPPFTFPCPHWKSLAEEQGDETTKT